MYVLRCVMKSRNALCHLCGNKDMLGLFRLGTQISVRADLLWYKNSELIYSTILKHIKIEYKEY